MYWYVLILTVQPCYAALRLDSLLQFCQVDSAVLETSASNDSNASSSMFQSTLGPAPDSRADPLMSGAGLSGGAAAASAAGASGGAGSADSTFSESPPEL